MINTAIPVTARAEIFSMSMASQLRSRISPLHSPLLSSYLARSQSQYARQAPLLSQSRHLFAGMKYLMDSKSKKSEDVVQNKVAPEGIHGENADDISKRIVLILTSLFPVLVQFEVFSISIKNEMYDDDQERRYFIVAAANYL